MIVLIILAGVFVLGIGSCVVLGGLVYLGAQAEAEEAADPNAPPALPVASGHAPGMAGTSSAGAGGDAAPANADMGDGEDDGTEDEQAGAHAESDTPSGAASASGAPKAAAPMTVSWFCNATGFVRVCGFANVCSNQMVSGSGMGDDRFVASRSAKLACEGMAIAKGGSTVCSVSCSAKSR